MKASHLYAKIRKTIQIVSSLGQKPISLKLPKNATMLIYVDIRIHFTPKVQPRSRASVFQSKYFPIVAENSTGKVLILVLASGSLWSESSKSDVIGDISRCSNTIFSMTTGSILSNKIQKGRKMYFY